MEDPAHQYYPAPVVNWTISRLSLLPPDACLVSSRATPPRQSGNCTCKYANATLKFLAVFQILYLRYAILGFGGSQRD